MIMIVGSYQFTRENENDMHKGTFGGRGLNLAKALQKASIPVGFTASISQDETGLALLDHLIENEIIFDPPMCNCEKPSLIYDSKQKPLMNPDSSALAAITQEQIVAAWAANSDVKVFYIEGNLLNWKGASQAIQGAVKEIKSHSLIYLDLAGLSENSATKAWRDSQIRELLPLADIVEIDAQSQEAFALPKETAHFFVAPYRVAVHANIEKNKGYDENEEDLKHADLDVINPYLSDSEEQTALLLSEFYRRYAFGFPGGKAQLHLTENICTGALSEF